MGTVLLLEYRLPLGCCVHLTPALEALHRGGHEVAVATRGLGLEVLRHSPFVDHLIPTPDPLTELAAPVRALRRELGGRGVRPECVLTGASDQRTRIGLLGLLGSSGWRGGYTQAPWLYRKPLVYDWGLSLIRNNLRLAEMLGCAASAERPRVFFSQASLDHARGLLGVANRDGRPVVVMVTQTSGGQSTGWHTERWVAVIRAATERGCAVVYVGTAEDAAGVEAIRTAAGGVGESLAGRTTVTELAALLAESDWVVSVDTGTMHVGRAVGVPMVVLGPSWQKPLEWMPLGVENIRILRGADWDDVPPGYRLDEISVEDAVGALGELMAAYPASEDARSARVRESLSSVEHSSRAPNHLRRRYTDSIGPEPA